MLTEYIQAAMSRAKFNYGPFRQASECHNAATKAQGKPALGF